MRPAILLYFLTLVFPLAALASDFGDEFRCDEMEYWDFSHWMCMPLPIAGMPMSMLMVHGNAFASAINAEGPRGGKRIVGTNELMADYGKSVADRHYFNIEIMATAEKWTMPQAGYPEIAQVGDYHQDGQPFVDRQHPHSSPLMGLTFSDTINIGGAAEYLRLFAAPRGASTDGPVAFLHRPTGMVNPLAPLGHHLGQDSGHVSSSVFGFEYGFHDSRFEFSTFNGEEPSPTKVDMPTAIPNSYAARLTILIGLRSFLMISGAYVQHPDPYVPQIDHYNRYSFSLYNIGHLNDRWTFFNSFIYGLVRNPSNDSSPTLGLAFAKPNCVGIIPTVPGESPNYPPLPSITEEFLFDSEFSKVWGRIEFVKRTPGDLEIFDDSQPASTRWVSAWTIGYTHSLASWGNIQMDMGVSLTKTFLPVQFQPSYGGNPISETVFIQVHGMKMTHL